jgi:alkylhydroperoxidase family enzyme
MSFINTTPATDATDAVLEMYQRQETFWGFVPNYAKLFCHRPEVMARWGRLLAEIRRPVADRRFELVTFAVAHELRNSACALAHGQKLADMIGADDVVALARGDRPDSLTAAERAIVEFSRRIARDASRITGGEVEALKVLHGLTDADVFDIAAIASARAFFTKILDSLGCEPDASFMEMEDTLRQALTVGRPIDCKEPEYTADYGAARHCA